MMPLQRLRRQYLYFGTSKASTFVLGKQEREVADDAAAAHQASVFVLLVKQVK